MHYVLYIYCDAPFRMLRKHCIETGPCRRLLTGALFKARFPMVSRPRLRSCQFRQVHQAPNGPRPNRSHVDTLPYRVTTETQIHKTQLHKYGPTEAMLIPCSAIPQSLKHCQTTIHCVIVKVSLGGDSLSRCKWKRVCFTRIYVCVLCVCVYCVCVCQLKYKYTLIAEH